MASLCCKKCTSRALKKTVLCLVRVIKNTRGGRSQTKDKCINENGIMRYNYPETFRDVYKTNVYV